MTLFEAFDEAYHTLNAGGVPAVLCHTRHGIRDFEVRLRWTGPKKPLSSDRGPLIVESRKRTDEGWLEWRLDETPFSVDDLHGYAGTWSTRYPDHKARSGYPCPRCAEGELRTDDKMIALYGPFTAKHTCGLQAFEDDGA